jgi:Prenyltransferase and squalene oxidase repeat
MATIAVRIILAFDLLGTQLYCRLDKITYPIHFREDSAMTRAKGLIATLVVTIGGLALITGFYANEKPILNQTGSNQESVPVITPENDGDKPEVLTQQPRLATDGALALGTAVEPKPLCDSVKKGLEYLVKQQNANGGWGQGGGWRVANNGRVEGAEDPPDVGNTCLAVLALVRAGNTPKDGPYAKNVAKGVDFICGNIEKADGKTLYVTEIKGTQLQSKIGEYVDTFLSSMVLAELKGRMQDESNEKRMVAALTKTINKMEANQKSDGTFAGNVGWASVLSNGLANKGFARASQNGVTLNSATIANVGNQVAANFDGRSMTFAGAGGGGVGGAPMGRTGSFTVDGRTATSGSLTITEGATASRGASAPTDAGVPIYNASTTLTNCADVSNTYRKDEKQAREVLAKKDASSEERSKAKTTLENIEKNEKIRAEATTALVKQLEQPAFLQGFGSNGGEEFLSFMNISEALLLKGGDDWKKWDKTICDSVSRVQDKDGSWSGQHCITGRTACTASALLVLMADRAPIPVAVANNKVQK